MAEKDRYKDEEGQEGSEKPFGMPGDYFSDFSARLLEKIAAEDELKEYPLLASLPKKGHFAMPVGYFDGKVELSGYPALTLLKKDCFAVPSHYFEWSEERFTYPLLVEYHKLPFETPAAYFDGLTESIENAVLGGEPVMPAAKENSFAVPPAYFENFEVKLPKEEARVIPLFKKITRSYQLAAAAAVLFIISLGIVFYSHDAKETIISASHDCNTIACLSKQDIIKSGILTNESEDVIIEMIDEDALSDSLSIKKNGKTQKLDMDDVSENMDLNTLTEEL